MAAAHATGIGKVVYVSTVWALGLRLRTGAQHSKGRALERRRPLLQRLPRQQGRCHGRYPLSAPIRRV